MCLGCFGSLLCLYEKIPVGIVVSYGDFAWSNLFRFLLFFYIRKYRREVFQGHN